MHQVVQDQVQPQKLVGLGGNILGVDGAVILSDLMSKRQHQGAGTGRRVINRHILNPILDHNAGNDGGNGMGRVVLGILAKVLVVVFDQILKNLGKEIVVLLIHLSKTEFHQLIDNGAAEQRLFGALNHVLGDGIKELDLLLPAGLNRKDIQVIVGDVHQSVVKQFVEWIGRTVLLFHGVIILVVKEVGDVVRLLQAGRVTAQHGQQHLILVVWHGLQRSLQVLLLR